MEYFLHREERIPQYDWFWEGWVPLPWDVTLTDTPERGADLTAEAMTLLEANDADYHAPICYNDRHGMR